MSKLRYYTIACLTLILVSSCSLFEKEEDGIVIARVNNHRLTEQAMRTALDNDFGVDSATTVQAFINEWATNKLLMDGALRNLSESERSNFETLVEGYRNDLYTKYYKDGLVQQQMDSVVSDAEAEMFYNENQNNFLLNEKLIQLRFVQVDLNYPDLVQLKKTFTRFNLQDQYELDSLKIQYKNHFLNDSVWLKQKTVINQLNVLTASNADMLLKNTKFLQLRDSLGLYLISIKNTLNRNDIAPLQYVRPTINQIIKNRRKVALVKKLEKEIKDDAIKNNKFEIYN